MSRTRKQGKRSWKTDGKVTRGKGRPEAPEILGAVRGRRTHGSTENILRRNRKTWTRLASKRRRRLDKRAVEADHDSGVGG